MKNGKSIGPRDLDDERRGRNVQDFARRHGVSVHTIKRAISHGLIDVRYYGDRPIIPASEHERICREGLPKIPPGYQRMTKGPVRGGRPRGEDKTSAKAGKPKATAKAGKPKVTPQRRPEGRGAAI